jgi:hypothetical protein
LHNINKNLPIKHAVDHISGERREIIPISITLYALEASTSKLR